MKHSSILILTSAFLLTFTPGAEAHGKPLPPAFGKELVPDEQTEERNEPKDAEMEEERDKREEGGVARHSGGHGGRGGKIHIELDGDEDGGDAGTDDDGL